MRAVIFVVCSLAAVGVVGAQCPTFWTPFKQSCYRVFGDEKDWHAAENACKSYSSAAHLVSINDDEENEFVHTFWHDTLSKYNYFWVGGTDESREGRTDYLDVTNFHRKLK